EVRIRLARAPGGTDRGFEHAIGKEIQPPAIGRPDRTLAVVAIGGDRLNIAGADIEDANLVELVVGGFDEGKPVAVGGPGEIAELAVHGLRNASIRPGLEVVEPELLVPIGMGEPLTI